MKTKEQIPGNNSLLNLIAPVGFKFYKNKMEIGELSGKAYGIIRYNENVDYGWMEPLMNIPGTVASLSYEPLPEGESMEVVNNNLTVLNRKKKETTDKLALKRLEIGIDNSEKMLDGLCRDNESVGATTTTIMTCAAEEYLDKADGRLRGQLTKGKHRYRLLSNLQQEAYSHISPCGIGNEKITNALNSMSPLRSVIGGFPFASSGFNDGSGYVFGTLTNSNDSSSSNMILDLWKRGQDRNNSHITFMGEPGVGKSTKLKDLEIMEYAMGTKIFAIDPEREQKHLCKKLKGNWINAGGGNGKINPLQVRVIPTDPDEDGEEDTRIPDLALYLMHLKAWFQMACPGITTTQLNKLEKMLIKTYQKFNMVWDTDFEQFKNTDYPIMSDLLQVVEDEIKMKMEENPKGKQDLLDIRDYIDSMVNGSLQFLWNGYTTVDMDARMVVFDTYDLQEAPDYVKGAQYYNILTWMWWEASKDRQERVLVVADEAYLMIDRKIPQSLIFLRNALKRGRKYEISFALVSHSLVDFLDPEVKRYGEAILDASAIKILMGTDGTNLKETVKLYNLTEAEEETLALKQRGLALMIIGKMHMKVMFDVAEYKWDYLGSAGGR